MKFLTVISIFENMFHLWLKRDVNHNFKISIINISIGTQRRTLRPPRSAPAVGSMETLLLLFLGQGEVFRRNHLFDCRLAELKIKRSIVTFPKNDIFLLLCLSNQIYCFKNILLNCFFFILMKNYET